MIDHLPQTPAMLVSAINMLLRDGEFSSLEDLCGYYDRDMYSLLATLADAGYSFSESGNCFKEATPDVRFSETHQVLAEETAAQVGSGLLPVYATPSVVALMEHTACELIASIPEGADGALRDGDTTVGTRMAIDHVKACLVGEEVTSEAVLLAVNGRQYDFHIEVKDHLGNLLAKAEHTRFLVNADRFMAKLQGTGN